MQYNEKLSKKQPASEWIHDFVHSKNSIFKNKTKKERISMALGAYYGAKQNEEYGAGFEGTAALRDKYIKDTPGQKIQYFKTSMKNLVEKIEKVLKESFRPGHGMVPAPIGKDTYKADGLIKLWGIQMRAGKWADTFVGLYKDGSIGIINNQDVDKYRSVPEFEKAFAKYRKTDRLEEAININDYTATSEKSQLGGYRPKVIHTRNDSVMYLGSAAYNKPEEAAKHAKSYLDQYARGISEPIVSVKGTYVKEALKGKTMIDVEALLDAAAALRKEFPQLRKGQSIMITLHDMDKSVYDVAKMKADPFNNDSKIPELIRLLDPSYYNESYDDMLKDEVDKKLDDILKQHKQEWDKIKSGKLELFDSDKLYDELFAYFSSEMPYGVAKARTGDPDEWIMDKLEQMGYLDTNIQENTDDKYSTWIIKPRDGGEPVKIKAPDETSAIEIALGRKPSQHEIEFFNFHYICICEKLEVSTARHMKIVELATNCHDETLLKEFVTNYYKPKSGILQIKESFGSFISNKKSNN